MISRAEQSKIIENILKDAAKLGNAYKKHLDQLIVKALSAAKKENTVGTIIFSELPGESASFQAGYFAFTLDGKQYSGGFGEWDYDIESGTNILTGLVKEQGQSAIKDFNDEQDEKDFISAVKFKGFKFKNIEDLAKAFDRNNISLRTTTVDSFIDELISKGKRKQIKWDKDFIDRMVEFKISGMPNISKVYDDLKKEVELIAKKYRVTKVYEKGGGDGYSLENFDSNKSNQILKEFKKIKIDGVKNIKWSDPITSKQISYKPKLSEKKLREFVGKISEISRKVMSKSSVSYQHGKNIIIINNFEDSKSKRLLGELKKITEI